MEEFDTSYLAWILYKLFYGIDKEVAKNKERSYVEIDFGNKIINHEQYLYLSSGTYSIISSIRQSSI